jgi:hypothetical protein
VGAANGNVMLTAAMLQRWRAVHGSEWVSAHTLVTTLGLVSVTPRSLGMHLAHAARQRIVVDGMAVERGKTIRGHVATWRITVLPSSHVTAATADPGAPASDEAFELFEIF